MSKAFKEYHTKKPESMALLHYYLVMPFDSKALQVSAVSKAMSDGTSTNEGTIISVIRDCVATACQELQYNLIVARKIQDDGVVEVHPVVYETHVELFLKLPATISVHTAFNHIKTRAYFFMKGTSLEFLQSSNPQLFSTNYLALSGVVFPCDSEVVAKSAYIDCLITFFTENDLHVTSFERGRAIKDQIGRQSRFMTDRVSVYD